MKRFIFLILWVCESILQGNFTYPTILLACKQSFLTFLIHLPGQLMPFSKIEVSLELRVHASHYYDDSSSL